MPIINIKKLLLLLFIGLLPLAAAQGNPNAGVTEQGIKEYPIDNLIRTACSLDSSEDVFLSWNGTVYDVRPGQQAKKIFHVSGFNVARCFQVTAPIPEFPAVTEGVWFKSSRELMVYLDPDTGDLVDTWTNPDTGESVPVMHVANSPATFPLGPVGSSIDVLVGGATGTFEVNVPLAYPNPAFFNPATKPYANYRIYTANEFFKWNVPVADLDNGTTEGGLRGGTYDNTIRDTTVAWTRQSPYLPWMNMNTEESANGYLLLSATATKVGGYDDLFPVLKRVVEERAPIFKSAPSCVLGNPAYGTRPGPPWATVTSWSYFAQNIDSYLNQETFPLFQDSDGNAPCIELVLA